MTVNIFCSPVLIRGSNVRICVEGDPLFAMITEVRIVIVELECEFAT